MRGEGASLTVEGLAVPLGQVAPRLRVRLAGSLDHRALPRLRPLLRAAAAHAGLCLRIDLAGVDFIDASGVGVLLTLQEAVRGRGGAAEFLNPAPRVRRILAGMGITDQLALLESSAAATEGRSRAA